MRIGRYDRDSMPAATFYKGPARGTVSANSSYPLGNALDGDPSSKWETADADPSNTKVYAELDRRRQVGMIGLQGALVEAYGAVAVHAGNPASFNAVAHNGSSTRIDSAASLSSTEDATLCIICRLNRQNALESGGSGPLAYFGTGLSSSTFDFSLEVSSSGEAQFRIPRYGGSIATITSTERIDDGQFFGLALTLDNTAATAYLVRPGDTSATTVGTATTNAHDATQTSERIRTAVGSQSQRMDLARLWLFDTVLSSTEVYQLITAPTSLLARGQSSADGALVVGWTMTSADVLANAISNEGSGGSSGNGTITSPAWIEAPNPFAEINHKSRVFSPYRERPCLLFDGVNDVAEATNVDLLAAESGCIGVRFYPDTLTASLPYLAWVGNTNYTGRDWGLIPRDDGTIDLTVLRVSGSDKLASTTTDFTSGKLHCVGYKIDPVGGTAKIYVDGVEEGSVSSISSFVSSSTATLRLASRQSSRHTHCELIGPFVRIAGLADMAELYRQWSDGAHMPEPWTYGLYTLGEGTGTVLTDHGVGSNNMTITGATWGTVRSPSTAVSLDSDPRQYPGRWMFESAQTSVDSILIRVFDPDNDQGSMRVGELNALEVVQTDLDAQNVSTSFIEDGSGITRMRWQGTVQVTREQYSAIMVLARAGQRVVVRTPIKDDAVGQSGPEVIVGTLEAQAGDSYAKRGSVETHYRVRMTVTEAG